MADEETVSQETPSTETADSAGGGEVTFEGGEQEQGEALPGEAATEAASEGGEAAATIKPAEDDILQNSKVQEAISRLQSTKDAELAAVRRELREVREQGQKPAQQSEAEKIQARLAELDAALEVDPFNAAALREAARLEARLEVSGAHQQLTQAQQFQTVKTWSEAEVVKFAPELGVAPDSPDYAKGETLMREMMGIAQQHNLIGRSDAAYLALAVHTLKQSAQKVEAARREGAQVESKRQVVVKKQGSLPASKGAGKGVASLTASQLETAKVYGLTPEKYAKSLEATAKGGTVDAS